MTCPPHDLRAETTKGKATGKVSWKVHVTDNSVIVNPNAKINVTSSHQSLQEFPIGVTTVVVTARDCAGNLETCKFQVEIRGQHLYIKIPIFTSGYNIWQLMNDAEYEFILNESPRSAKFFISYSFSFINC